MAEYTKPTDLLDGEEDDSPSSLIQEEDDSPSSLLGNMFGDDEDEPTPTTAPVEEDEETDVFEPKGETKPKLSYPLQILELLGAPRNLVNKKIDESIAKDLGNPVVSNEGKHDASSLRANLSGGNIGSGYRSDPERGWREDLSDLVTSPLEMDADKAKTAGSRLGARMLDTVEDFSYETLTDPMNLLAFLPAAKGLSTVSKMKTGAATGLGLGITNQLGREEGDETPYIGPIEGAAIGTVPALAIAGAGKVADVGDWAIEKSLKGVTKDFAGKKIDLSLYPRFKQSIDKKLKETAFFAHELRQGRLKALSELSDESAVKVNEFASKAKELQNKYTPDEYIAEAKTLVGEDKLNKALNKTMAEENIKVADAKKKFLEDNGYATVSDLPADLKAEFDEIVPDEYGAKVRAVDKLLTRADGSGKLKSYMWNKARRNSEYKFMNTDYDTMIKELNQNEVKSTLEWAAHNAQYIEKYNKAKNFAEVFDESIQPFIGKEAPQGYVPIKENSKVFVPEDKLEAFNQSPITGFKFHNADVYDKKAFEQSKKLFNEEVPSGLKRGTKAGESDAVKRMVAEGVPEREAYDRAYSVYSNQAAGAFLDSSEREAAAIVAGAREHIKNGFFGVPKTFDALTSAWKKKVLYLNTSWAKVNYYDNMMKTFLERGYIDAAKSGTMAGVSRKLTKDIDQILLGNPSHIASDRANELLKYGVIDSDIYRELSSMSDVEKRLNFGPNSKAIAGDDSFAGKINRMTERAFEAPVIKQVSGLSKSLGQQFEWNARAVTWDSMVKQMEKKIGVKNLTPEISDTIRKNAAKDVNDVFFDYGNVRAIEQEIGKRYVPFYAFMTKNMDYYGNKFADPSQIGKINQVVNMANKLGGSAERDPEYGPTVSTENNYLQKGNPRRLQGEGDFVTYASAPKLSMFDALNSFSNPYEAAKQGIHPLIKGIADLQSGRDTFSGQPLDPDKNPFGGKNWLGQKGYKGLAAGELLGPDFTTIPNYGLGDIASGDVKVSRMAKDLFNLGLGTTGVKPNPKTGSPETDSKATMYNQTITSMLPLVPPSALGTAFNIYNSPAFDMLSQMAVQSQTDEEGKNQAADWLTKLLTPVELIKKDEEKLRKTLRKVENEGKDEAKKFRKNQQERNRSYED